MDSNSPNRIPTSFPSLACLQELSLHDQGIFLLTRLGCLVPRGATFSKSDLSQRRDYSFDPYRFAAGLPEHEQRRAIYHLFDAPWNEIEQSGYIAKVPRRFGWYEITDKGRALVSSIFDADLDERLDGILPSNRPISDSPKSGSNGAKRRSTYWSGAQRLRKIHPKHKRRTES